MKIGIVTVHRSNNYGAFHQAIALKSYLEQRGNEVCFIKHSARKPLKSLLGKLYEALRLKNVKAIPFILKQEKEFVKCKDLFVEISLSYAKDLDLVVLGSDEIWNIKRKNIRNFPIFFGVDIDNENIISYAPSINNATKEDFLNSKQVVESIKNLKGISVRDAYSQSIVKEVVGQDINLVTDPTMLHDKSYYLNMGKFEGDRKPYILVYSYGKESKKQAAEISKLKAYAEKKQMEIISIMGHLDWVDKNIIVSPYDVFTYFNNAQCVVTDTFHGTIFSLMLEKTFWILTNKSKKVEELLRAVGLLNRKLENKIEHDFVSEEVDYKVVNQRISEMREKSVDYLNQYLGEE